MRILGWLRPRVVDLLVVVLAAIAQVEIWLEPGITSRGPTAVLYLVTAALLLARRRAPLVACVLAFAAMGVGLAINPQSPLSFFALMLLTFWIAGASNDLPWSALSGGAGLALVAYGTFFDSRGGGLPDFLLTAAIASGIWAAAVLVRRRWHQIVDLHQEQAESARAAVAAERARISREMHDVIAHSLGVVVVQTVALLGELPPGPQRARVEAIETTSRQALDELRRLLGFLEPSATEGSEPAPGVGRLPSLVEQVRSAGIPVRLDEEGERRPLPPSVDLSAYRIVQEALTNVAKHTNRASTTVTVKYRPHEVQVEVADEGPPVAVGNGTGRGLIGMRERAALCGGRLESGSTAEGGFRIIATLPSST